MQLVGVSQPSLTVATDARYTVAMASSLAHSSNGGARPWVGFPVASELHVIRTTAMTPALLHSFYGVPPSPVVCEDRNIQAVGVPQPVGLGYYSYDDLAAFYDRNGVSASEVSLVKFVGGPDSSSTLAALLKTIGWTVSGYPVTNIEVAADQETT